VKIGLYSITYLGIWYRGGALSMPEFIQKAKALGYSGIEIDGKRPHGNPMDLDQGARREIKQMTADAGLDMVGVASNNDFSSPIAEHRESQLLMVREQIKLCKDLGGKVVRLFLAWPGVTMVNGLAQYDVARRRYEEIYRDTTRAEIWDFAKACFKDAAHIAEQEGVIVALQNHAPVIRHYRDVLDMVEEVDSPAFQAIQDVPIEPNQSDAWVRQMVLDTGARQVHAHFGGEFERGSDGKVFQRNMRFGQPLTNYPTYVKALKEIGYKGYFCFEFCHPAVNKQREPQGIEFVTEQAALAREFLQDLLVAEGVYEK
jgi:sugar phosphate isomerase/epimerase